MATLDEIRTAIKTTAESVSGIGNVYDQMPHIANWDKVFEYLKKDDELKVFFFSKLSRDPKPISEGFSGFNIEHKWIFKYIYSASYDNESDKTFDNICENICSAFDNSNKLGLKVKKMMPMQQINKGYVMVCGVLCHYAEFEITTSKSI